MIITDTEYYRNETTRIPVCSPTQRHSHRRWKMENPIFAWTAKTSRGWDFASSFIRRWHDFECCVANKSDEINFERILRRKLIGKSTEIFVAWAQSPFRWFVSMKQARFYNCRSACAFDAQPNIQSHTNTQLRLRYTLASSTERHTHWLSEWGQHTFTA